MRHTTARVPPELTRTGMAVLRPRDADGVYAFARPEFARLTRSGALHKVATGYYAVVPDRMIGRPWLPDLESTALGIATADAGTGGAALMGLSAARVHHAIPRAIGVAVVATPAHRAPIRLRDRDATVVFARRDTRRLDLQRHRFELGDGYVTTVEQTVLDLAAQPDLGGMPDEAAAAARALLPRADQEILADLARAQRRKATLDRLLRTQPPVERYSLRVGHPTEQIIGSAYALELD